MKSDTKYYIREIKNLFTVGQTYPVTEVPGPHSRKITNTIKHRLQIIAFKLLQKSAEERLKISRLMKYFPDQNELQMRQRLKVCRRMHTQRTSLSSAQEFMEYHRRGPHQGFWRLKANWTIPSDADMLKMVTPEQVVLAESMQVGQRHLQDSGYSFNGEVAEDDEGNLSIEQQLAPWITTKNFLFATQAKAMLRLHGEGDPTGRGEAFSFIRVSMKDIFVKAGEDYDQKLGKFSPPVSFYSADPPHSRGREPPQVGAPVQRRGAAADLQVRDRAHLEGAVRLAQSQGRAAAHGGGRARGRAAAAEHRGRAGAGALARL